MERYKYGQMLLTFIFFLPILILIAFLEIIVYIIASFFMFGGR